MTIVDRQSPHNAKVLEENRIMGEGCADCDGCEKCDPDPCWDCDACLEGYECSVNRPWEPEPLVDIHGKSVEGSLPLFWGNTEDGIRATIDEMIAAGAVTEFWNGGDSWVLSEMHEMRVVDPDGYGMMEPVRRFGEIGREWQLRINEIEGVVVE